ncbi:hypothetical protein JHK85_007041 [Glycine max]|uniref:Helitron helicase-like domain-containing protein n=2 Tax=Glycine subgen. Soja TaxID=1462606 RepID=A0A0R0KGD7_SOYBN|nr:hypothetical protein JHK87_006688 [Glycine soja]KAG5054531.1 hypothetical protein JHK85_007041 [Glycine max]KAG5071629.1 hypothetical protein JHK86_006840 [Glycine max]RZC19743.1 hypothetical protein D0Y65_006540 [Glycine soja]
MMFAFMSLREKVDRTINNGKGAPTIHIQGQPCHRIGSLLPMLGGVPKFAELNIYDTEHEVQNILHVFSDRNNVDPNIVSRLTVVLDEHNSHAKSFHMVRDRLKEKILLDFKLKLIANRVKDGRIYNIPIVSEVVTLFEGDFILETRRGDLQRINELHASYLALQYPLLFPYGEDGYTHDILHKVTSLSEARKRVLQFRPVEATLLHSRKLFQEFVVDGYTMLESKRLAFSRMNESKLRVDKYSNLHQSSNEGTTQGSNRGKKSILPSTFVGSPRYMEQLHFDGMAICNNAGFSDVFVTFTCNPNWNEIQRLLSPMNLKVVDRPDIISRVFKIKFEQMLTDLAKQHLLGEGLACELYFQFEYHILLSQALLMFNFLITNMYTIEFQNRGLPHVHLLLFLYPSSNFIMTTLINNDSKENIPTKENRDEIKKYFDYRYISPCEAILWIFAFPMHGRKPTIERLYFHLPGQQLVYYHYHENIDDVLSKQSVVESMLTSWMHGNQNYLEDKNLTYSKFVSKFVYIRSGPCQRTRKKRYTIGRLIWVSPTSDELFYLRMMLTISKGSASFEDI